MGSVNVCDKVCLGVVLTSSLLCCDEIQSPVIGETPWEGIYDNRVSFGGSVLRQIQGVQRKPLPKFAIF